MRFGVEKYEVRARYLVAFRAEAERFEEEENECVDINEYIYDI